MGLSSPLMNKTIKLIYIVTAIFSFSSIAQLDDLSMLGKLGESLTQSTGNESEGADGENSNSPKKQTLIPKQRDYSDEDYGYTGRQSFGNAPISKFPDEPMEFFGYSYFSNPQILSSISRNAPVPPDYLIGPDDNIKIILYGSQNKKYNLKVNRDGEIFIQELGPLSVAGLTFNQMQSLIEKTVTNQIIGSSVSTTMGALRSIDVFILGAANNPGMYSVNALSSVTNAIFQAGGVDISGSLRNIKLKRNGKLITQFDLYELLIDGDTSSDGRLMQGDVILIEPIGKTAGIRGEVNRSNIYELLDGEKLGDLLRFAGNLRPKASKSSSEIMRVNTSQNSFDLISIDMSEKDIGSTPIFNGDIVSVFPVNDKIKNAILINGHAPQPGFYSWKEGMKITDIFSSTDDLLAMTDLNYVLVKRKSNKSQDYTFLQIDLEAVFDNSSSSENILLMDQDEIFLLPSLLSPSSITTRLIQDKYLLDEDTEKLVLEDEWDTLTFLRKSLMEEKLEVEEKNSILITQGINQSNLGELDIRRYYEYSIYDYCTIPEDLAILVIEESGFRAKKSVPLEDLEQLKSPADFITLQQSLEKERIRNQDKNDEQDQELAMTITNICRKQLLDPILDIVNRDNFKERLSMVSVFGSVHFPGSYPYTENMKLSDAIQAAGGPKNGTYNSEIELSSLTNSGKQFITSNKFSSIDQANSVVLSKMDTINLKQISTKTKKVTITGEVFFPGTYPISENQTLSELIERAGGITQFGSADAAYFQREALKKAESERFKNAQEELKRKILLSSQAGGLGQASLDGNAISQLTALIATDTEETDALGRLVIDLDGILSGKSQDIILEDGDVINIPQNKQSVSVIGEVFVSNSHIFREGLGIDDYINLSGGSTLFADESSIYLIRSDGSIVSPSQMSSGFFRSRSSLLQPGDTIVVPLQVQPFSGIKATTEITQIIYQMALAAAAVNSF